MAANSYDAFAEKRAQTFAVNGDLVHAFIEKPAMYALLPELKGRSALCVGCGTGEECQELLHWGAQVTGIDISSTSITYAKEHVPGVVFRVMDIDSTELEDLGTHGFDFIYSSLTLHYSRDLAVLLHRLHSLLSPTGSLLFSVGHPLRWASQVAHDGDNKTVVMGYRKQGSSTEVFGDYLTTRQFTQQLSNGPEVTYWMRPISAYFQLLEDAGFAVAKFVEPLPLPAVRKVNKAFWELRTKMPVDMIFLAKPILDQGEN